MKSIELPSPESIPAYIADVDLSEFDGCDAAILPDTVELDSSNWGMFKIGQLFEIRKGQRLTKANMRKGNTIFVGASDSGNGETARIGQDPIHEPNTITVSYNGSVAEAFYQPDPYWPSDDINVLYPKFEMSAETALFICAVIRLEKYRFNYGRKWHLERMKESEIRLPKSGTGQPDFNYMDRLIQSLPFSSQIHR